MSIRSWVYIGLLVSRVFDCFTEISHFFLSLAKILFFFCLLENCYLRFVIFGNRVPNAYCSAGVCFAVAMNWWNSVNTANVF